MVLFQWLQPLPLEAWVCSSQDTHLSAGPIGQLGDIIRSKIMQYNLFPVNIYMYTPVYYHVFVCIIINFVRIFKLISICGNQLLYVKFYYTCLLISVLLLFNNVARASMHMRQQWQKTITIGARWFFATYHVLVAPKLSLELYKIVLKWCCWWLQPLPWRHMYSSQDMYV